MEGGHIKWSYRAVRPPTTFVGDTALPAGRGRPKTKTMLDEAFAVCMLHYLQPVDRTVLPINYYQARDPGGNTTR